VSGADYIKVGLYDIQTREQAMEMLTKIVRSVKDYDKNKIVVASGYSDYKRINSISPFELPAIGEAARRGYCDDGYRDQGWALYI